MKKATLHPHAELRGIAQLRKPSQGAEYVQSCLWDSTVCKVVIGPLPLHCVHLPGRLGWQPRFWRGSLWSISTVRKVVVRPPPLHCVPIPGRLGWRPHSWRSSLWSTCRRLSIWDGCSSTSGECSHCQREHPNKQEGTGSGRKMIYG